MIDHTQISSVLGDRLLVRRLDREERRGRLWLAPEAVRGRVQEQVAWWGVVEAFGRDVRYDDAYGLQVGDLVGFTDVGARSDAFECVDREWRLFVPEEFACVVDAGRVAAARANERWGGDHPGLRPVGPYCLVRPEPVEERRGGLHVPHAAQSAPREGEVLAVSAGELGGDQLTPLDLAAGARVLFGPYSAVWARVAGAEFALLKCGAGPECEVRAVLEPVPEVARA